MVVPKGMRLFLAAIVLDIILALLLILAITYPTVVEEVYTYGFFPWYAESMGVVSDIIPFSIHEAAGLLLAILALFVGLRGLIKRHREKTGWLRLLARGGKRAFITISCMAFLFYLLWGFNYFRPRFVNSVHYDKNLVTQTRTAALADKCVQALTTLTHVPTIPDWQLPDLMQSTIMKAMLLVRDQPLKTATRVKYFLGGWFSALPSTGVTLPLLPEIHVSLDLYEFEKPFIIAHEKAHLQGRALESEANYLALLACLSSDQPAIRKSGLLFLYRMLVRALPARERAARFSLLASTYLHDLRAPAIRMSQKNPVVVSLFRMLYGNFLKAQRIEDGLANYSAALQLALGYRLNSGQPLQINSWGQLLE